MIRCVLVLKTFFVILITSVFSSSVYSQSKSLELLAGWLEGVFSSELQAAADTSFSSVRLEMRRIAQTNSDAIWFYVEQAMNNKPEKPYRQRLQRVYQNENTFISETFEFPNPLSYTGGRGVDSIPFTMLTIRHGCAVYIQQVDDQHFAGKTLDQQCLSSHRGAHFATTEIVIRANGLYTWDRGFNAYGEQVWGSKTSGYHFLRQNESENQALPE